MGVLIRSFFCLFSIHCRMSIKAVSVLTLFVSMVSGNYYPGYPLHYPVHYPAVSYAPAQYPDLTFDNAATAWKSLGAGPVRHAYSTPSYQASYLSGYAPASAYAPGYFPYTVNGQVLYYPTHALRQEYSSTYAAPSYVPAYPSYTPAYPSYVPDNYAYGHHTGNLYSHGAAYGAQGQVSYW